MRSAAGHLTVLRLIYHARTTFSSTLSHFFDTFVSITFDFCPKLLYIMTFTMKR